MIFKEDKDCTQERYQIIQRYNSLQEQVLPILKTLVTMTQQVLMPNVKSLSVVKSTNWEYVGDIDMETLRHLCRPSNLCLKWINITPPAKEPPRPKIYYDDDSDSEDDYDYEEEGAYDEDEESEKVYKRDALLKNITKLASGDPNVVYHNIDLRSVQIHGEY
ncbi:uncharacterized protein L199_000977 [Kwoniella botswanensis]|uniref:uncharacterized protein n=1 Tax=Kwoniella botswanensis TaxID=1268659 RepID=UPI00315DA5A4